MTHANQAMIRLEHISKRYQMGDIIVSALEKCSFAIHKGEFVAIMGPSGSGKTTLLQILGALDTPTEGQYFLEGNNIAGLRDNELARIRNQHFGFVFQAYNLFPDMTAFENVELPLIYAGVAPKQRRVRVLEQLLAVGLEDRILHRPTQLSGGQQQRVAIARALVTNPTLVLADEPTGNLSQDMSDEILSTIWGLNQRGVSVVMVTHDPMIAAVAKRKIIIRDGKLVSDQIIDDPTTIPVQTMR